MIRLPIVSVAYQVFIYLSTNVYATKRVEGHVAVKRKQSPWLINLFDMFYNAHNVMFIVDYPVFSF